MMAIADQAVGYFVLDAVVECAVRFATEIRNMKNSRHAWAFSRLRQNFGRPPPRRRSKLVIRPNPCADGEAALETKTRS
ncbi:MAG: hypothetical protein ACLPSW_11480 [Roseiarcus sp.]